VTRTRTYMPVLDVIREVVSAAALIDAGRRQGEATLRGGGDESGTARDDPVVARSACLTGLDKTAEERR